MMQVLFVASEMAGFVKAGGLGEVAADLPRALARSGVGVRVLLPGFPAVLATGRPMRILADLPGRAGTPPAGSASCAPPMGWWSTR
jgi:starch synthase